MAFHAPLRSTYSSRCERHATSEVATATDGRWHAAAVTLSLVQDANFSGNNIDALFKFQVAKASRFT